MVAINVGSPRSHSIDVETLDPLRVVCTTSPGGVSTLSGEMASATALASRAVL
jgi:hypothetical protein